MQVIVEKGSVLETSGEESGGDGGMWCFRKCS